MEGVKAVISGLKRKEKKNLNRVQWLLYIYIIQKSNIAKKGIYS